MYIKVLRYDFKWKGHKNEVLKQKWKFGFEYIVVLLHKQKNVFLTKEKREQYAHQRYFLIPYEDHIIRVPCFIEGTTIHLITFYYSRQDTEKFL